MEENMLYLWFTWIEKDEKLSELILIRGDIGATLLRVLTHSLITPPDPDNPKERVEVELGYVVIQALNQIIALDLNETPIDRSRLQSSLIPITQLLSPPKPEQIFAHPSRPERLHLELFLTAMQWLIVKPQFYTLADHFLPADVAALISQTRFQDRFEKEIAKPFLKTTWSMIQKSPDMVSLAKTLRQTAHLSTQLHRLLDRSLDQYTEITQERHPTQAGFEPPTFMPPPTENGEESLDDKADEVSTLTNPFSSRPQAPILPPWGRELVIIAKLLPVWLHQLSAKYDVPISTLDQIPDQEFQELKELCITGLWLVGVWKRSEASKRIKNALGNPHALASAYSIADYQIDPILGGEEALVRLKEKAQKHGIFLGADVIPNHTAIDSRWLKEHPEWFISSKATPFSSYAFNGPNLSGDEGYDIRLEDHYYDHSDAAVVFRFQNRQTASEPLFVYHGNDGTHIPWNDTAQLDYLNPETRKNMIDTIAMVSRHFPLIRLDAAMTLTKMHYKRLWYPPPGQGGAIPSRSGQISSDTEFDHRYGFSEFWQEAVKALNQANPDALLLAEAFWLMEPYFINHIGMHKVYHSAFMNLLRDHPGKRFNEYLSSLLAHHPITTLDHFVNFLSTPDETPSAVAFGKGDRFLAASVLLVTQPGTPLFSHNQWEGLEEQYGMEFSSPIHNQPRDLGFFQHIKDKLLPILKRRSLFSRADSFQLGYLETREQAKGENVIVFLHQNEFCSAVTVVNYQDGPIEGRINPALPMVAKPQLQVLSQSHNCVISHDPAPLIALGPWGHCVLLFE